MDPWNVIKMYDVCNQGFDKLIFAGFVVTNCYLPCSITFTHKHIPDAKLAD
jgi:hypothetical protein